jgi:hypothetical protein
MNMPQSLLQCFLGLCLFLLGSFAFAQNYQVYEGSFDITETKKTQKVELYMRSAIDSAIRIRAVNFSIAYDSACSSLSSYDCILSERWTTFIERSGSLPAGDSLQYGEDYFNRRWIFGTGQMPKTENLILPANTDAPIRILTVIFDKKCKNAPLYLEDEKEFRVNQMGDENNKAVPWVMRRSSKK